MSIKKQRLITGLKSLHINNTSQYSYQSTNGIKFHCKITQHFPQLLTQHFPFISAPQIIQQFQTNSSLSLPAQLLGKKSSQIFVSGSRRYCIKTVDKQTFDKIQQIYPQILAYKKQTKYNYLVDIYMVIEIQATDKNIKHYDYFIVMPSLRANFQQTVNVFDIKGYLDGRRLDPDQFKDFRFGKDENFVESNEIKLIGDIDRESREEFVQGLLENVHFLEKLEIIDYSLLLSFRHRNHEHSQPEQQKFKNKRNTIYINENIEMQWSIIDYFQAFNKKKMFEKTFKTFFRKEVSSIEPDLYCQRFGEFIQKYFLQLN